MKVGGSVVRGSRELWSTSPVTSNQLTVPTGVSKDPTRSNESGIET